MESDDTQMMNKPSPANENVLVWKEPVTYQYIPEKPEMETKFVSIAPTYPVHVIPRPKSSSILPPLEKRKPVVTEKFKLDDIEKPLAYTTNPNLDVGGSLPPVAFNNEGKALYAVRAPLPPKEPISRPRSALKTALLAAAARLPDRPPEPSRASVLKGQTWTIHQSQSVREKVERERIEPVKSIKKLFNTHPIQAEPYDEPSSSSIIKDPATISLFDEEEVPIPTEWVNAADSKILVTKDYSDIPKPPRMKRKQPSNQSDYSDEPQIIDGYPRPGWSYSCLIALALKNSRYGYLTVSEIYAFIMYYFPFFRKAPEGWRNSVRHNLSLNKAFAKLDMDPNDPAANKRCSYWMISPDRLDKVNADIQKWRERDPDPASSVHGLAFPEYLEDLEAGVKGMPPMDERSKPIYSEYPQATSDPLRSTNMIHSLEELFKDDPSIRELACNSPSILSEPLIPPLENHNFTSTDMFFEDSPLMDHFIPKRSCNPDQDNYTQSPEKSTQRRHSNLVFSPFKDETNIRSLTPVPDTDYSMQGILYNHCLGSFESAMSAINDNSLLHYSQGNSTKFPTTFPDNL